MKKLLALFGALLISCSLMSTAFANRGAGYGHGGHHGYHGYQKVHSHARHGYKGVPPGWHHGKKVGWHGAGRPPGQVKKGY